jgi:hypothetical protein
MAHFKTFTPHFTPLTHTMYSSSSRDGVEGQVVDALFSIVDQAMTMLKVVEASLMLR